jgi:hypothetical protein
MILIIQWTHRLKTRTVPRVRKMEKTHKKIQCGAIIRLLANASCSSLSLAQLSMKLINYVKNTMVSLFFRAGNDFRGQGMHLNYCFPYKK